jgi:hypothetical protein
MKIQFLGSHTITLSVIQASSTQKPEMPWKTWQPTPETNPARSLPRLCPSVTTMSKPCCPVKKTANSQFDTSVQLLQSPLSPLIDLPGSMFGIQVPLVAQLGTTYVAWYNLHFGLMIVKVNFFLAWQPTPETSPAKYLPRLCPSVTTMSKPCYPVKKTQTHNIAKASSASCSWPLSTLPGSMFGIHVPLVAQLGINSVAWYNLHFGLMIVKVNFFLF